MSTQYVVNVLVVGAKERRKKRLRKKTFYFFYSFRNVKNWESIRRTLREDYLTFSLELSATRDKAISTPVLQQTPATQTYQ